MDPATHSALTSCLIGKAGALHLRQHHHSSACTLWHLAVLSALLRAFALCCTFGTALCLALRCAVGTLLYPSALFLSRLVALAVSLSVYFCTRAFSESGCKFTTFFSSPQTICKKKLNSSPPHCFPLMDRRG